MPRQARLVAPGALHHIIVRRINKSPIFPKDPFTGAPDWITVAPEGDEGGVFDVHSASPLVAVDGTPYNTW